MARINGRSKKVGKVPVSAGSKYVKSVMNKSNPVITPGMIAAGMYKDGVDTSVSDNPEPVSVFRYKRNNQRNQ